MNDVRVRSDCELVLSLLAQSEDAFSEQVLDAVSHSGGIAGIPDLFGELLAEAEFAIGFCDEEEAGIGCHVASVEIGFHVFALDQRKLQCGNGMFRREPLCRVIWFGHLTIRQMLLPLLCHFQGEVFPFQICWKRPAGNRQAVGRLRRTWKCRGR